MCTHCRYDILRCSITHVIMCIYIYIMKIYHFSASEACQTSHSVRPDVVVGCSSEVIPNQNIWSYVYIFYLCLDWFAKFHGWPLPLRLSPPLRLRFRYVQDCVFECQSWPMLSSSNSSMILGSSKWSKLCNRSVADSRQPFFLLCHSATSLASLQRESSDSNIRWKSQPAWTIW